MAARNLFSGLMAAAALSLVQAQRLPVHEMVHRRALDDPSIDYLANMCYPNYMKIIYDVEYTDAELTAALAVSPLPCEQQQYVLYGCIANASTSIDFLAEQQCVCGSNFLDAHKGCVACYTAHGYREVTEEEDAAKYSSIQSAECTGRPTQPFTDLLFPETDYDAEYTSQLNSPTIILVNDKFPNNTAVSNYWTGPASASLGSITGSATARATEYSIPFDDYTYTTSTSTRKSSTRRANFSYTSSTSSIELPTPWVRTETIWLSSLTGSPVTREPVSAVSQVPTTTSTSANGGGMELGLAGKSGVVLVIVNVIFVALL